MKPYMMLSIQRCVQEAGTNPSPETSGLWTSWPIYTDIYCTYRNISVRLRKVYGFYTVFSLFRIDFFCVFKRENRIKTVYFF
jgi:hypothetical protein